MDGHHANLAGEYLGACVFYETLFQKSVFGNSFIAPKLDPAYARFLQETAHTAVQKSLKRDYTKYQVIPVEDSGLRCWWQLKIGHGATSQTSAMDSNKARWS